MKITFFSPRSNLSGGLRVIATYAQMLQDRGHTVTIVTPSKPEHGWKTRVKSALRGAPPPPPETGGHFDPITVPVIETGRADFHLPSEVVPDSDVLIATWWETAFAVAAQPDDKGQKCYLVQGHEVFDPLPWQISRGSYYLPLKPIVIAGWLADVLRTEYGRDDAVLAPNGIDLKQFHAPPRAKAERPTIGFLYSTSAIKGSETVLRAITRLQGEWPDLQVIAFGTQPVAPELPLPPDSVYHQQPDQSFIREIYAACDLFICGSTSEGFFLPLLEAMACRTPLVSTRVGAAPDLITEDVTGHIVDVGNDEDLAVACAKILSLTDADWSAMSEACLTLAKQHSWDKACDRFEHILQDLVTDRGSG